MNGHRQRGMAIISALLIVTVVAVIAAGLIARQSAFIRALESEQLRIQAGWMLRGGLEWSRQLLLEDSRRDPLTRLDQRWAQPMRGLRLSSAELPFNGQLEDEQGKFNLRNLLVDQRPDLQERANFERLAGLLGVRHRGRWFLNRGDFVNRLNMPQLQAQSVKVGITSDWFLLTAYARRDRQEVRLQALVQRKAGESTAVNWMRVGS